jgi:hypothetical protein
MYIHDAAEIARKKKGLSAQIKLPSNGIAAIYAHWIIHREAVATKEVVPELHKDVQGAVTVTNFTRSCALNSHLSSIFCKAMGSGHDNYLHAEFRRLSRERELRRAVNY